MRRADWQAAALRLPLASRSRKTFGSAANLNIHLHCLVLDGVYRSSTGAPVFHEARAPSAAELETLLNRIIERIVKLLTRTRHLIEEQGMSYLAQAESDRALTPLQAAGCTYRIALGPRAGKKVLSLQTVPSRPRPLMPAASFDPKRAYVIRWKLAFGGSRLHMEADFARHPRADASGGRVADRLRANASGRAAYECP